jgi:hypothetical protein
VKDPLLVAGGHGARYQERGGKYTAGVWTWREVSGAQVEGWNGCKYRGRAHMVAALRLVSIIC